MQHKIASTQTNELGDTEVDWLGFLEMFDGEVNIESKDELVLVDAEGRILL